MPEIELGIGYSPRTHDRWTREWLYWYDQNGNRFPAPQNIIEQQRQQIEQERQRVEQERQRTQIEQQQAEQERQRAEQERQRADNAQQQLIELMAKLQERGINLDDL